MACQVSYDQRRRAAAIEVTATTRRRASPAIERAMEEAVLPQDDETKEMIERGELSDHPARFWRKGGGEGRRRRGGR